MWLDTEVRGGNIEWLHNGASHWRICGNREEQMFWGRERARQVVGTEPRLSVAGGGELVRVEGDGWGMQAPAPGGGRGARSVLVSTVTTSSEWPLSSLASLLLFASPSMFLPV